MTRKCRRSRQCPLFSRPTGLLRLFRVFSERSPRLQPVNASAVVIFLDRFVTSQQTFAAETHRRREQSLEGIGQGHPGSRERPTSELKLTRSSRDRSDRPGCREASVVSTRSRPSTGRRPRSLTLTLTIL
jgi:hypothetical protein